MACLRRKFFNFFCGLLPVYLGFYAIVICALKVIWLLLKVRTFCSPASQNSPFKAEVLISCFRQR